jgi:hypothetical protein
MAEKRRSVFRPRVQTREQERAEKAIRTWFQKGKPNLQDLIASGELRQVFTMGQFWQQRKLFPARKVPHEE